MLNLGPLLSQMTDRLYVSALYDTPHDNPTTRVKMDNLHTWRRKLHYAVNQKLAGVYVFRLDFDDYVGDCNATHPGPFPFASLVKEYFPSPVKSCDKKNGNETTDCVWN